MCSGCFQTPAVSRAHLQALTSAPTMVQVTAPTGHSTRIRVRAASAGSAGSWLGAPAWTARQRARRAAKFQGSVRQPPPFIS